MSESFFDRPLLTSPHEYPARHWELDEAGQPTVAAMLIAWQTINSDGDMPVFHKLWVRAPGAAR